MSELRSKASGIKVGDAVKEFVVKGVYVPPTKGIVFADDFSSGDYSHVQEGTGAYWRGFVRTEVNNLHPYTGKYSAAFNFQPASENGYSDAQADIVFGPGGYANTNQYNELWIRFNVRIPDNYDAQENIVGNSSNNKAFIWFWGGTYDTITQIGPFIKGSLFPKGDGSGTAKWILAVNAYHKGKKYYKWFYTKGAGQIDPAFSHADRGKWVEMLIHWKAATWADLTSNNQSDWVGDGIYEMWWTREGQPREKVCDIQDGHWISDTCGISNSCTPDELLPSKGVNYARLLGWQNAGNPEGETWNTDNIIISTEPLL